MKIKVLYFFLILIAQVNILSAQVENPDVEFTSSKLPIIIINTNGEEIVDEPKITAQMQIINNGEGQLNSITDTPTDYNGFIGIEYRGASSQKWPKKQFGVETRDSIGENLNISIFGMPKENDWVIYSFYVDKTLMLNPLMYGLAADMGWYAPRTQYCEMVINGEYMGIYMFTEKLKRDKNRVAISKNDPVVDITGGYFLELIVNSHIEPDEAYFDMPVEGKRVVVKYPDFDDITPEQLAYISNYFSELDLIMQSDKFADPIEGYAKYIDVPSFVDHMLISEAFNQLDAYSHSEYFNKDAGGKLKMGPVWDFDRSIGNAEYYTVWRTDVWWLVEQYWTDDRNIDLWYKIFWPARFMQDPIFMEQYANRWFELRKTIFSFDELYGRIDANIDYLDGARERNFERWGVIGVDFNNKYLFATYKEEIEYMKDWIEDKFTWMDLQLEAHATSVDDNPVVNKSKSLLKQNYPNSFSVETTIEYTVPEQGHVTLEVYNSLGIRVDVLVNEEQESGDYSVVFNAGNLSGGMYIYKLRVGNRLDFKNMLLSK